MTKRPTNGVAELDRQTRREAEGERGQVPVCVPCGGDAWRWECGGYEPVRRDFVGDEADRAWVSRICAGPETSIEAD